jgi:hypothetical protein
VLKDGDQLEILAQNRLDDRFSASAALPGNSIFLRGEKFLYCLAIEERQARSYSSPAPR